MKHDTERDEIRERLRSEHAGYQGSGKVIALGIFFCIFGFIVLRIGISLDNSTILQIMGLVIMGLGLLILYLVYSTEKDLNKAVEQEMQERKEQEKQRQEQNQRGKDHSWVFPAEEFYTMCAKEKVTNLSKEYSFVKATNYAQELIARENPLADMSSFSDYLGKEKLQSFLTLGKMKAQETAQVELVQRKTVQSANPAPEEATFLARVYAARNLTGSQKRVKMLKDLMEDCDAAYQRAKDDEEAWKQLAMLQGMQQKKEKDWAIRGGAAQGIAGPVAGAMTALETMQENEKIREYNRGIQETANGYVTQVVRALDGQSQATVARNQLEKCIEEATGKIALPNPNADTLWANIIVENNIRVSREKSGVLDISLDIRLERPVNLDLPTGVEMVIDGTITANVLYENKKIGEVVFLLPIFGMPCDEPATITLKGMCDNSVGFDNGYTVQVQEKQHLWVMEAASRDSIWDVEHFFYMKYRPGETVDQCKEKHTSNFDEEKYNRKKAFFNDPAAYCQRMDDKINKYLVETGEPATISDIVDTVGWGETSTKIVQEILDHSVEAGIIKKETVDGRIVFSWNGD